MSTILIPTLKHLPVLCLYTSTLLVASVQANENVSGAPESLSQALSVNNAEAVPPSNRILEGDDQLTDSLIETLGIDLEAVGQGGHPFTTKRASASGDSAPVGSYPWSATGKLFMRFGTSNFVCTASVIGKSLLATAAHCVHNYGDQREGFADAITFEPGRHELSRPYGSWQAKQWWIPKVYFDGTDVCSPQAPGVVCENDVAVIVLEQVNNIHVADVAGQYEFNDGPDDTGYGFVNFLGQMSAQITQLGYPSRNFNGDKMIRTDSLGFQDTPNNVVIGSNQTGGSSGGPWLENFGTTTSFSGPPATDNESNQVVAVTSWGFTSGQVKIQGASMFSKNTTYTEKSNIQSLVDSACTANPGHC